MDWERCQGAIREMGLDGWLLADRQGKNPVAITLTGLSHPATRLWFCFIPSEGEVRWLVPSLERGYFEGVFGEVFIYSDRQSLIEGLKRLLKGFKRVAMEYSPKGELPSISHVDAGTKELVESLSVQVVSSADLVHWVLGRVDEEGFFLHRCAAEKLLKLKDEAFQFLTERLVQGEGVTEWDVAAFLLRRFREEGLVTVYSPIVAVMGNSADPHYMPTPEKAAPIGWGDFVLIDIWAKVDRNPKAIYADITWCGYTGSTVPPRFERLFQAVREARDAVIAFLHERVRKGILVQGYEADRVAREVIARHGFAERFIHRTGHNLGGEVHGLGVNLDGYETFDTRPLTPFTLVTVEPGIYGPEIGVRSEVNVFIGEGEVIVTTLPLQEAIIPLI